MRIDMGVGVSGVFNSIEVLDKDGNIKRRLGEFNNLITDIGLLRLASGTSSQLPVYSHLRVSTDTTEPSTFDTGLVGQVASVSSYSGSNGVNMEEGYAWRRQTWTFPVGAIPNQNISKIGTGWGAGEGQLFSVALVKDAEGNPTSITILEDEQLRVTWEHRRYWPTEDTQTTIVNTGNKGGTFTCTSRARLVGSWRVGEGSSGQINIFGPNIDSNVFQPRETNLFYGDAELGAITENMSGNTSGSISVSSTAGVDGASCWRRYSLSLAQGNSSEGIGGIAFGAGASSSFTWGTLGFQVKIDPPIMKTNQDVLEIEVGISWERAT